jgi:Ca-activated chloride channel family protein
MHDFSFAAPDRLWLFVPLLALAALGVFLVRRRRTTEEPYAEAALMPSVAPHRAGWRRPAAAAGLGLAIIALTSAFARPQVLAENAHERAVVMIALDTSASMLATDVSPDRFTAAKNAAKSFIRDLPAQVDVGLVGYNETATLAAAPTSQHEQVAAAVDKLTLAGGTAMGDALELSLRTALRGIQPGPDGPAVRIVLLSDGDSTTGTPIDDAIASAVGAKVPVSTIAYGTAGGTVVSGGRTFQVPVNAETLARVASGTGGKAYDAATASQLNAVYDDIGTQVVTDTAREDIADTVAGVGLVFLLLTAIPSLAWFARLA